MPALSCACPRCHGRLQPPDALPATVECRQCGARCTLTAAGTVIPLPAPAQTPPAAQGQPAVGILVSGRPKPRPTPPAVKPVAAPEPQGDRPPVLLYAGLALLSVLVLGGAVWVVVVHERHRARPAAVAENEPPAAPAPAGEAPPARPPARPAPAPTPAPPAPPAERPPAPRNPLAGYVPPAAAGGKSVAVPPSLQAPSEGEWESSLSAEDQERVNQAIDRGVAYLKGRVTDGNNDPIVARRGGQALVGLTLLACGVPADDPAVRTLVGRVRTGGDSEQQTYDLALSILFLDRLGEPADRELIRTLALRLVAGQNGSGGWSYQCPLLRGPDRDDLLDLLETLSPPPGTGAAPSAPDGRTATGTSGSESGRVSSSGATSSPGRVMPSSSPRKTPAEARRRPSRETASAPLKSLAVVRLQPGDKPNFQEMSDNSNTQFAILALWVARKYGVPVERTLALVDARFRTSQNADGSWGYNPRGQNWPDSMTCAGLLGLAVGRGIVRGDEARKDSAGDPDIARGLRFLGNRIGRPVEGAGRRPRRGTGRIVGANAHGDLYFLWSVERVAVVYDLRTIADKDWYAWGAQLLVDHQNPDGGWRDIFDEPIDTCFALLFLKRVNVAQDLTATLRSIDNLVDQADGGKVGRVPPK